MPDSATSQEKKYILLFRDLTLPCLVAVSIAYGFYLVFYYFAPWIWSQNFRLNTSSYTPWINFFLNEHDGIEAYVLYFLFLLQIIATSVAVFFLEKIKKQKIIPAEIFYFLIYLLANIAIIFFSIVKINVPWAERLGCLSLTYVAFQLIVLGGIFLFTRLFARAPNITGLLLAVFFIPVCFVATSPISPTDYQYIFAPALRMLHGFGLSEIYFQYDIFLSLIAAIWLKLGLGWNSFQILGQSAFFAAGLALYFFATKVFEKKSTAVYVIFAFIIVRLYGLMHDPVLVFQVVPLRLDLWIILLFLVWYRGPYHWSVGLTLGFFALAARTFGLIYVVSYCFFVFTLFLGEFFQNNNLAGGREKLFLVFKKHARLLRWNLGIITCSFLLVFIIFGGLLNDAASSYQRVGIGFLPIAANSFYWYVPIFMSLFLYFILKYKALFSQRYVEIGIFLVFLALGNSLYFFGRSEEHNILNISAILILLLFFFYDVLRSVMKDGLTPSLRDIKINEYLWTGICLVTIFAMVHFYAARILEKAAIQKANIRRHQFIYSQADAHNFEELRKATGNSSKMYFLSQNDFYLYFGGGYAPVGYYQPLLTWIYMADFKSFLQGLAKEHYYFAVPRAEYDYFQDFIGSLPADRTIETKDFIIFST